MIAVLYLSAIEETLSFLVGTRVDKGPSLLSIWTVLSDASITFKSTSVLSKTTSFLAVSGQVPRTAAAAKLLPPQHVPPHVPSPPHVPQPVASLAFPMPTSSDLLLGDWGSSEAIFTDELVADLPEAVLPGCHSPNLLEASTTASAAAVLGATVTSEEAHAFASEPASRVRFCLKLAALVPSSWLGLLECTVAGKQ